MTRVLFICGSGQSLSPTAAQVFAERGFDTDFAAVASGAGDQLSTEQLDWAEVVMVMEHRHAARLTERFPKELAGKKIVTLDIRDRYTFMEQALVAELLERAGSQLR